MSEENPEIAKWYQGKGIFIPGATGFMGKVLVEKLHRSCPESGSIYLLIRDKGDASSSDRIEELSRSTVFEKVRATQANVSKKVFAVHGDMVAPDLGISDADRQFLLVNVAVVFHVGATVRFDMPLRMALRINVQGCKSLFKLCFGMIDLSAIVYVSTTHSCCPEYYAEERVFPPLCEPDEILHRAMQSDDDGLDAITSATCSCTGLECYFSTSITVTTLGDHPNTYTLTRALAEHVVVQFAKRLPIAIVRTSIVAVSIREPQPGWIDSINRPRFILRASRMGTCKYFYGDKNVKLNMIPVDVCINAFIAAALPNLPT